MWRPDPFPMTAALPSHFMHNDKISPIGNGKEWIQGTCIHWMDPLMDTPVGAEVLYVCRRTYTAV